MKLIKSNWFKSRKCAYGNFELEPEEGWKISDTFIDFESGLLIVSVSDENEANWEDLGYGGRRIPNKQFIINAETAKILEPAEWRQYFNYEKIVMETVDKTYRLTTQRIHEPERNTDSITEELEILGTGHKSTSREVAFRDKKRENLLEEHYRQIHERQKQKELLDAKPTLDEFFTNQFEKLVDGEVILGYIDDSNTYKLTHSNGKFNHSKAAALPTEYGAWKAFEFSEIRTYATLDAFWDDFTRDPHWFLTFRVHESISEKRLVLSKHVISWFNDLRSTHRFTFEEYKQINEWEHSFWSDEFKKTELKQWCANCYASVNYQARYPKYICRECASKEIKDGQGNILEFTNLGFYGGLRITRMNPQGRILVEEDQQFCDCIIDGKRFFAQEARFGGVVIQLKE